VADSNFFSFFSFDLLEGNEGDILNEPNQLVLTERPQKNTLAMNQVKEPLRLARTYFGAQERQVWK
jgi:hypothetical protein